jgi:hypothetical protein
MAITSRAQRRTTLAALIALAAIAAGATADAGRARGLPPSPLSQLRLEGPKANIEPGAWYVTGDESIRRSRGNRCKHRDGVIEVPGATALGIAETAAKASNKLPPLRVRPDDFGLFVCEIGGLVGRPFDDPRGFSGWTYWVDFAGGTQAAENEAVADGESVLWVFADFGEANRNTGGALELIGVPAYDADGEFTVQVVSHAFDGTPTPLAGAKIKGAESVADQGDGEYEVTVGNGFTTLYAKHKPDIASNPVEVCVRPESTSCPDAHGRVIVGSTGDDVMEGAEGWDEIRARGGADEIRIHSGGGRDEVDCGGGEDEVVVLDGDTDDAIADNCEEVVTAS